MSVPFSNTHLRVPRGFGTILEGLAREVLRDQPEDIPKYAAQYFDALLKQREDSGVDPAEWAAKLEDRFYNNHAFKGTGPSPEKEPSTKLTISKEKSYESQTEDESSHSAEASNVSTTQPNVSEEVDLTESTEEYEEKHDISEKHVISMEEELSEEESVNVLPAADVQPDDLSGTEEETITTFDQVDTAANGKDSISAPDQDIRQSELEPTDFLSFKGISNVDVCAQELETEEDYGDDEQKTAVVDEEVVDSEGDENTDIEEPVKVFPYPGLADVDVCATELGETERKMEGAPAEDDEGSSEPRPDEAVLQSPLSQSETPEVNQQEAEDQVEKPKEEEGTDTESSSRVIHESLAHIEGVLDSHAIAKEDSLVEISFDDVPEGQQIKEVEEKQPEEEGSVDVLQTKMPEMKQEEESKEVTAVSTDQNISHTQDHDEPAMVGVEKEVNSEGEEMESQHEASDITKEMVDTNDSNLNDSDNDEERECVKTISSSHQPTIDEENSEDERDHDKEDNEKTREISEGEFLQNDESEKEAKSNDPEGETTDMVGGEKEDKHTEGYSDGEDQENDDGVMENHSSQVTQANISTAADTESETLEASAHLPEENDESQRTPVESQLEDTIGEKEVTSKERISDVEELVEEEVDSEIQEKSDAMCEEGSISPTQSADRPAPDPEEEDSTEPEVKSGDKEECSRPQEEEDIMDIPLDDPEANRAAAKIQAGFRGHMTRKKMKPEDKAEGEEVSSTGDVLNCSQGDTETGGPGAVERNDTSVPEQ